MRCTEEKQSRCGPDHCLGGRMQRTPCCSKHSGGGGGRRVICKNIMNTSNQTFIINGKKWCLLSKQVMQILVFSLLNSSTYHITKYRYAPAVQLFLSLIHLITAADSWLRKLFIIRVRALFEIQISREFLIRPNPHWSVSLNMNECILCS